MYRELKEHKPHGTKSYPYTQYYMHTPRKAFHIPVHWHDEVEIIYIKTGRITISIQEEVFHATSGDLFFVNTGELHFMESDDRTVEYYTLLFPLEFLSFQTEDALEEDVFLPLRQKKLLFPIRIEKKESFYSDKKAEKEHEQGQKEALRKDKLTKLILEVIRVNEEKEAGYQLRTRILLLEMIEFCIKEQAFKQTSFVNHAGMQRELITYIQKHYTEKISLGMLAREFHLSEKYISWYFKEHFSISFIQYVSHLRMTRAKDLLTTTELSITEVALSCGYPSVNLFIRSFKELHNMTPLQYRKQTNSFT